MNEANDERSAARPTRLRMTSWEVLTWIAFGRAIPEERLDAEVAADQQSAAKIDYAKEQLRDRAERELLTIKGWPWAKDGRGRIGCPRQPVPSNLFTNPAITLTNWNPTRAPGTPAVKGWVDEDDVNPIKDHWDRKSGFRFEDMLFETEQIFKLWPKPPTPVQPRRALDQSAPTTKTASLPKKRRGPPDVKRQAAVQRMIDDITAGRETLETLGIMKQVALASSYGLQSRDTAMKALAEVSKLVGVSITDK